ncbi:hypothetical protein VSR82_07750 [Burkholderia sp. JPY481]
MQSSLIEPAPEAWPQDGVPESWVTELFRRMGRMWGNAFLEKWPQDDLRGVKIEWARGLRKLSTAELKAGVDALMRLKFPPSLPEFYGLCKQMRLVELPKAQAVTDQTKADAATVESNLERMRRINSAFTQAKEPTAEWAFRLLIRGATASGGKLGYEAVRCAYDAVVSSAGRRVVENCADEDREAFTELYQSCVDGARAAGQPLWETP